MLSEPEEPEPASRTHDCPGFTVPVRNREIILMIDDNDLGDTAELDLIRTAEFEHLDAEVRGGADDLQNGSSGKPGLSSVQRDCMNRAELVLALNEWMRKFIEAPREFDEQMHRVAQALKDNGEAPSYGLAAVGFLEMCLDDAKKRMT